MNATKASRQAYGRADTSAIVTGMRRLTPWA
jgi:hypothetical protein